MSRKHLIYSYNLLQDQVQPISADRTSNETNVAQSDYGSILLSWSGGPITATVEVQAKNGERGDWYTIDMGTAITMSGASGSHHLIFNQFHFTTLRLQFDVTSGSATISAVITTKSEGA